MSDYVVLKFALASWACPLARSRSPFGLAEDHGESVVSSLHEDGAALQLVLAHGSPFHSRDAKRFRRRFAFADPWSRVNSGGVCAGLSPISRGAT